MEGTVVGIAHWNPLQDYCGWCGRLVDGWRQFGMKVAVPCNCDNSNGRHYVSRIIHHDCIPVVMVFCEKNGIDKWEKFFDVVG